MCGFHFNTGKRGLSRYGATQSYLVFILRAFGISGINRRFFNNHVGEQSKSTENNREILGNMEM